MRPESRLSNVYETARPLGCGHRTFRQSRPKTYKRHGTMRRALQAEKANKAAHLPELSPLDGDFEDSHRVSRLCNWLIPGLVLVGRYPFIEPSRCFDSQTGEAQLRALLDAGINTFVSLQAELPAQELIRSGGVAGFRAYKPTATMIYSTLGQPPSVDITAGIRNNHLNKFLPPKRSKEEARPRERPELQFIHSPITDLGIPTTQQVSTLLEDLCIRLEKGAVLYLHCWGGRGRAGTVGACLLAKLFGISAEEALIRVQKAFDTRKDNKAFSPETEEQRRFVRDFVNTL